jgi:hypothetical protein
MKKPEAGQFVAWIYYETDPWGDVVNAHTLVGRATGRSRGNLPSYYEIVVTSLGCQDYPPGTIVWRMRSTFRPYDRRYHGA